MLTIHYQENGLRITEIYGKPNGKPPLGTGKADLIACFQLPEPEMGAAGGGCLHKRFKTLYIDLEQDEEALFAGIHRSTRNEIRRAAREPFTAQWVTEPAEADLDAFCTYYNGFANRKQLPPVRQNKLRALAEQRALVLSSVTDEAGDVLCRHAYIADGERATSLYIASHRAEPGSPKNRAVSRANKYLHWLDMKAFKAAGYRLFDFGGLSLEAEEAGLQNVNRFKEAFGGETVIEYKRYEANSWRGRAGLLYLGWKWRHSPETIKMDW